MAVTTTTSAAIRWRIHTGTLQEVLDALDGEVRSPVNVVAMFANGAGFSVLVKV